MKGLLAKLLLTFGVISDISVGFVVVSLGYASKWADALHVFTGPGFLAIGFTLTGAGLYLLSFRAKTEASRNE